MQCIWATNQLSKQRILERLPSRPTTDLSITLRIIVQWLINCVYEKEEQEDKEQSR